MPRFSIHNTPPFNKRQLLIRNTLANDFSEAIRHSFRKDLVDNVTQRDMSQILHISRLVTLRNQNYIDVIDRIWNDARSQPSPTLLNNVISTDIVSYKSSNTSVMQQTMENNFYRNNWFLDFLLSINNFKILQFQVFTSLRIFELIIVSLFVVENNSLVCLFFFIN